MAKNSIGIVRLVTGHVTATGTDNVTRALQAGDRVYANDLINTGADGVVEIVLVNGERLDLGRGRELTLDSEVYQPGGVGDSLAKAEATAEAIQKAILAGKDPTDIAEAPAAGGADGAGGGNEGHGIVQVALTGQRVTPESGFETRGLSFAFRDAQEEARGVSNTAPSANDDNGTGAADDVLSTPEDTALVIVPATLLANDVDPDGDVLSIVSVQNAVNGTVALVNGEIVFTPNQNFNGDAGFTYTVSDGNGGTATATVTVVVTPVNDAPSAGNDGPAALGDLLTTPEDTALNISPATLLANDSDVDGDTLTIVSVQGAVNGTVALVDGKVLFTPDPNFNGDASFTYTVSDGHGGSDTATVIVNVTPVNDPPVGGNDGPEAANDALTTAEDTPLNIPPALLLANDSDLDGDALSVTAVSNAQNGTVALVNGQVVFTPDANYHGPAQFDYTISDGHGGTAGATVFVTVTPVNDMPSAGNDGPAALGDLLTTPEDTALNISPATLLANDSDVDGDTLTIVSVQSAVNGTVVMGEGGIFFTPASNFNGIATFTYTVSDGHGGSDTATVTVNVTPVNDPPTAGNDGPEALGDLLTTPEDTALVITPATLLANDSDLDGDTLTIVSVQDAVNGTVALVNGNVVFTPPLDFNGTASFTYTISDGNGGSDTATVTVTVTPVNDPPVAQADSYNVAEGGTLTIIPVVGLLANDSDLEGDLLTSVLVSGPAHGTLTLSADGSFSYVHDGSQGALDSFTYKANDGGLDSNVVTVTINITGENDAPDAVNDALTTPEDTALTISPATLLGNDTDPDGDTLFIVSAQDAVNGTVAIVNGNVVFTPAANFHGAASFTYTVSDGQATDTATVTVNVTPVNDPPLAANDSYSVNEDAALVVPVTGVLGNDSDVDGDPLSSVLVSGPAHGTLTLNADGSFSYTPDANFNGADSFTYRANDGTANSNLATISITVNPVNDAPVAAADNYNVAEGGTLNIPAAGVLGNDSDVDGDPLSSVLVSGPAHGTLTLNADGSFSYVHDGGESTSDSFTYKANDGSLDSNVVTVNIGVTPVNDVPDAVNDAYNLVEGGTLTIVAPGVLANDSDVDGDPLTVTTFTQPLHGTLTLNADGSFTYVHDGSQPAPDSFTYTVSDGNGGTDTATVSLGISNVNDVPDAVADSYTVDEGATLNIVASGVLANDTDADGDSLQVTAFTQPAHGTLTLNADGSFSYVHDGGESTSDSFTYTISDGNGGTDTATVSITVTPVNDVPDAVNDALSTPEDVKLVILPATLLANDTDADGDTLTITSVQDATNGTVMLVGGNVEFTPAPNFNGTASFTYTISDGNNGSDTATVTINVTSVDDFPSAVADSYSTNEDTALVIVAPGVLGNDSIGGDGGTLAVTSFTQPAHGTLTLNADGSFTYTPTANYNGPDSFNYSIQDADGDISSATVNLTVNSVDDFPSAVADIYSANEDTALIIAAPGVLGNDSLGGDGGTLAVTSFTQPAHGTLTLNADGSFTYTPTANYNGPDSFNYSIQDADGDISNTTVSLTVNAVNDAPATINNSITVNEDSQDNALGISAPTDADGDSLTITVTGLPDPDKGKVTLADGTPITIGQILTVVQLLALQFDAAADANGAAGTFTYSVSDGVVSTPGQTTIVITPVNDAPTADPGKSMWVPDNNEDGPYDLRINAPQDMDSNLTVRVTAVPDSLLAGTLSFDGFVTTVAANDVLTLAQLQALQFQSVDDGLKSLNNLFTYEVLEDGVASGVTQTVNINTALEPDRFSVDFGTVDEQANPLTSGNPRLHTHDFTNQTVLDQIANADDIIVSLKASHEDYTEVQVYLDITTADGQTGSFLLVDQQLTHPGDWVGTGQFAGNGSNKEEISSNSVSIATAPGGADFQNFIATNGLDLGDTWIVRFVDLVSGSDQARYTSVEIIFNASGADTLKIVGDDGIDLIYGDGDDILIGNGGDDVIVGNSGNDTVTGGSGADTFVLNAPGNGVDVITDYNQAEGDVLDLSAVLTGFNPGVDDLSAFLQVNSVGSDASVSVDTDGSANGVSFTEIATLQGIGSGATVTVLLPNDVTQNVQVM